MEAAQELFFKDVLKNVQEWPNIFLKSCDVNRKIFKYI